MKLLRSLGLLLLVTACIQPTYAQLKVYPNLTNYGAKKSKESRLKSDSTRLDTLSLPFFDDFSSSSMLPDSSRWVPGGGTFIGNTGTANPLTVNVATFDGVDETGTPYRFSTLPDAEAVGPTDQLVSCPIDLSNPNLPNLRLSFYWQREGNSEFVDRQDSLRVEFKNAQGEWVPVFGRGGALSDIVAVNQTTRTLGDGDVIIFNESDSVIVRRDSSCNARPDTLVTIPFDAGPGFIFAGDSTRITEGGENCQLIGAEVTSTEIVFAPRDSFLLAVIPITDPSFLHNAFQFRFQTIGGQSSLFDAWHIDYVYLDTSSTSDVESFFPDDRAFVETPNSFLQRYSAMPINQYIVDPDGETSASIRSKIISLQEREVIGGNPFDRFGSYSYSFNLRELNQEAELFQTSIPNQLFQVPSGEAPFNDAEAILPPGSSFSIFQRDQPAVVQSQFVLASSDTIPGLPSSLLDDNDTISRLQVLDDYFAYDDGSAELGIGVANQRAEVAIRFELNERDTLTDIQFHLVKFERDLTGQTFNLVIWQDIVFPEPDGCLPENVLTSCIQEGNPIPECVQLDSLPDGCQPQDSVILRINVPIIYPETRNGFISIRDTSLINVQFNPIAIDPGIFYVGFQQVGRDLLTFGFDRNRKPEDTLRDARGMEIFVNDLRFGWNKFAPTEENLGYIMLRPVFGQVRPGDLVVTSVEDTRPLPNLEMYPNPAQNIVFFRGEIPRQVQIFDTRGRLMLAEYLEIGQEVAEINTQSLPPNIYIVRSIFDNGQSLSRRLVILK